MLPKKHYTVEPPYNETIGTAMFSHYSEVFFIERYIHVHNYNGTVSWYIDFFIIERFSLLGEFIIGCSTV